MQAEDKTDEATQWSFEFPRNTLEDIEEWDERLDDDTEDDINY